MDGPDAVRILGRRTYQRLSQSVSRLRHGAANVVAMTARQIETWKKTPIAVNTQPDISNVGNRTVMDMAVRAGAWMRSDSIIVEEPIQIDELANRPPWTAAILEDGYFRQYDTSETDTRTRRDQRNGELHAACPGSAGELLVSVDRSGQSRALQRDLSARIRTPAHHHRVPFEAIVGVATKKIWHFRSNRLRVATAGWREFRELSGCALRVLTGQ